MTVLSITAIASRGKTSSPARSLPVMHQSPTSTEELHDGFEKYVNMMVLLQGGGGTVPNAQVARG